MTTIQISIISFTLLVLILIIFEIYAQQQDIKKEHKEIQEEKKLEDLRKRLGDKYNIQYIKSMSRNLYSIIQINKKSRTCFNQYYTLQELEEVVSTIKSFSL